MLSNYLTNSVVQSDNNLITLIDHRNRSSGSYVNKHFQSIS
jgi:hypothetical protein